MQRPPEKWYFNQLSVISYQLSVISYQLSVISYQQKTPQFPIHNS
ncbi:hypothetical protein PN437_11620 [Microcystis aeruginosa CS-564/01]|nr:hypothetical protein [Microcystis aeruginosa CS-564/01]